MTTQTHTQGPWDYDCYGEHFSFFGNDGREDYSFRVEYNKEMPEEEQFENNHLIAAAPDMLNALRRIESSLEHEPEIYADILSVARAAIAKAGGAE